jgi:uncharacterized protein with HEPN domain
MSLKKSYIDYIQDMIDEIDNISFFLQNITFDEFVNDKKTYYASIRSLEIIGEACKKIPFNIIEKYSKIPWISIQSMRNKLAHEYFGVDLETVWLTIKEDLKELNQALIEIINS